jgi:hypothetical protein
MSARKGLDDFGIRYGLSDFQGPLRARVVPRPGLKLAGCPYILCQLAEAREDAFRGRTMLYLSAHAANPSARSSLVSHSWSTWAKLRSKGRWE